MFDFSKKRSKDSTEVCNTDTEPRRDVKIHDESSRDNAVGLETTEEKNGVEEPEKYTGKNEPSTNTVWIPLLSRERMQKYWRHKYSGQVLFNEPAEIEFSPETMKLARIGRTGIFTSRNSHEAHIKELFKRMR